jgi:hypothetical protein
MDLGDGLLGVAGAGAVALGVWWGVRRVAASAPAAVPAAVPGMVPASPGSSAPGPSGGARSATPAVQPMTLATLLAYPVGQVPGPDALAWVPAQHAARVVQAAGQGLGLFALAHHPVGYYGPALDAAQRAAAYLWDLGVDPCPPALYSALVAAHAATGVPLPLLLGVAHVESQFLDNGAVPNAVCTPGHCTVGNTAPADGGPVGLLQVTAAACAQVGVSYAAAQQSATTNALAGARYLAYLAGQHGVAPTSTVYAAWAPVLAAYGEGTDSPAIALATSGSWVAQHTPSQAVVAQQTVSRPAAPAAFRPAAVTCQTVTARLAVGSTTRVVTSRVCSDGTRTVLAIS